jgi:hypothetical protein
MVNQIHARKERLHPVHISAIGLHELDAFRQVVEISADHVVAANDFVSVMDEGISKVTAEKSSDPGDKNFHEFCAVDKESRES